MFVRLLLNRGKWGRVVGLPIDALSVKQPRVAAGQGSKGRLLGGGLALAMTRLEGGLSHSDAASGGTSARTGNSRKGEGGGVDAVTARPTGRGWCVRLLTFVSAHLIDWEDSVVIFSSFFVVASDLFTFSTPARTKSIKC